MKTDLARFYKKARHRMQRLPLVQPARSWLYRATPKGLYTRSLLIIILPMLILQSVVAFVFMERHWQTVTRRLSSAVTADLAALIDVYNSYPQDARTETLARIARTNLNMTIEILPPGPLPDVLPRPFFSLLDKTLSREITTQIHRPFWIDTVGRSSLIEIRIQLDTAILRAYVRRNQAYASNSHIFIVWMMATAAVLLVVAVLFLRNQIKPILALAQAADDFGRGRDVAQFPLRGAKEVRQAAHAFQQMKRRIERQIEQRTTMLNGVSHDLRTILTRFRLQISLLKDCPDKKDLLDDISQMNAMLEAYLAFARGEDGEPPQSVNMEELFQKLVEELHVDRKTLNAHFTGVTDVIVRPSMFKRCLTNIITNALRHGTTVSMSGAHANGFLTVKVEDDGPGIPPDRYEDVFKPFFRLDAARNLDESGTGLGLAIARDIITAHGGDISLGASNKGGLSVKLHLPA